VASGQAELDAKIGELNDRMARLEGSLGPARKVSQKKADAAQAAAFGDAKTAAAIKEIRLALLEDLPRVSDVFRSFDRNHDGRISRAEFRNVLPILNLPKYGAGEMDALFDVMDADGSGYVDLHELNRLLRKGADVKLSASLQAGAKGEIEVEARNRLGLRKTMHEGELMGPLRAATLESLKRSLLDNSQRAIDYFRRMDRDRDGAVTRAEFREVLPLLGFDASHGEMIDELFSALDASGDGTLELEEMDRALRRDDIVLKAELQTGAVAFEVESRNRIELRKVLDSVDI